MPQSGNPSQRGLTGGYSEPVYVVNPVPISGDIELAPGTEVDVIDRANRDLGQVDVVNQVDISDRATRDLGSVDIADELPAGTQIIGYVRVLGTYDGTTYVSPLLDASTWVTTTIDYAHHEIHGGSYYHCQYHQMVSDINDRSIITFRTPDTAKHIHMFARGSGTALSNWYIWRAPTITNNTGATLPVFNRNHNSPNTSGIWDTSQNPDVQGQATFFTEITMGAVTLGTAVENQLIGYGSGPRATGGETRSDEEIILLPDTLYAFEIKSLTNDDNYHDIQLNWYEHTDKS